MITYTLLALIICFSLYAFSNTAVMSKYLFHPYSIHHNREHYRFLTHAFIHGDYFHLIFNCIALYSFGTALEERFFGNDHYFDPKIGKVLYLLLFTGGIYAASLAEHFRHRNNSQYSSLGASGAISAIVFSAIMVSPKSRIAFFVIRMPGWVFGLLMLVVSYILIRRKRAGLHNDNISHEAHFWGAIFGIVFTSIVRPTVVLDFFFKIMH